MKWKVCPHGALDLDEKCPICGAEVPKDEGDEDDN